MKKFLLTATALSLLSLNVTYASENKFNVGGFADFNLATRSQSSNYENNNFAQYNPRYNSQTKNLSANVKNYQFYSTGQAHVSFVNQSDNLKYGLNLVLQPVTSRNDYSPRKSSINRSFFFAECSNFGKLELGGNESPSNAMAISPTSLSVASEDSFDNVWHNFVAKVPNFVQSRTIPYAYLKNYVILDPKTYINRHPIYANARKIVYYTPVINGFQLGASYTPDYSNHGDDVSSNQVLFQSKNGNRNSTHYALMKSGYSLALNYNQVISDNLDIGLSAVMDHAKSNIDYKRNITSYAYGAKVKFNKFTAMGSYGTDGKSSQFARVNNWKSYYYSIGGSYDCTDKITTSMIYTLAKVGGSEVLLRNAGIFSTSLLSIGANYKLMNGLVPYLEADFYRLKYSKNDSITKANLRPNNRGTIVLAGLKLTF